MRLDREQSFLTTAAAHRRFIPAREQRVEVSLRAEVRALRQGRLLLALGVAMLTMGGVLATYTYVTPLLTDRAGVPDERRSPPVLAGGMPV
ncbi:hypothetical protein ABZ281_15670 [Streptomyces sp. NPDC006265]|uniref:hypothetical protein n=1 Tax=Streptomyces sp. NPDC006265 TaxID=3156740 RepID=UPI0033ADCB75